MNKLNFRNSKKGITPVIATIILIAGTLVLALVVGAYTFGLFGANVKTVQVQSIYLYSGSETLAAAIGTASLQLSLQNPGSLTSISSITLTGSLAPFTSASSFTCTNTGTSNTALTAPFASTTGCTAVAAGVNSLTIYLFASGATTIPSGATVNYVVNFANGQSVSGAVITQ